MSVRFVSMFTDENSDMEKQIGCMTGIFQMFDRHHLLTGRHLNVHNHKRLPPSGQSLISSSNFVAEKNPCSPHIVLEKKLSKSLNESRRRVSMDSSRASFSSSSRSSSFSSLEHNKSTQHEPPSDDQTIFPERSLKNAPKLKNSDIDTRPIRCSDPPNASAQSCKQSFGFQDFVKDSMYRDTRSLSVRTPTKEVKNHSFKNGDSPRPMQLSKSKNESQMIRANGKPRIPMDLDQSDRVRMKLKEAPQNFLEASDPPRSSYEARVGTFYSVSREAPRFSYDGTGTSCTSFDSREYSRSTSRTREFPRLSLDSLEGSLKSSYLDSKPNSISKDIDRRNTNQQISTASTLQKELVSHKQPPSVIAKLMGLETMPKLSLATQELMDVAINSTNKDSDPFNGQMNGNFFSTSSKVAQDSKQDQLPRYPKSSFKDPVTPRLKKPDPVMKPIPISRVPIETAPWRQQDRVSAPHKTKATFGYREAHTRQQIESVYGEIEKRLKELESKQSNKDLRALKQILDAMQAKGLLEHKKNEDQYSDVSLQKKHYYQATTADDQNVRSRNVRNKKNTNPVPTVTKGSSIARSSGSPIVVMKPAKSANISGASASAATSLEGLSGLPKLRTSDSVDTKKVSVNNRTAKDQTPEVRIREPMNQILRSTATKPTENMEENRLQKIQLRTVQGSSRPQQSPRENSECSIKTISSLSPRLQQRKLEAEKKSCPPSPSSNLNKPQRQSTNRQPLESVSPRGRLRLKQTPVRHNDHQLSEIRSETRNESHQCDGISLRSDNNDRLASQIEVTSADQSSEMNRAFFQQGSRSPSGGAANYVASFLKQKKSLVSLDEKVSTMELVAVAPEQPSPISVLNASFYKDDLPSSPVKKISNAFKDDDTRTSDGCWNPVDLHDTPTPGMCSEVNQRKLEYNEDLVQKHRQINSTCDEPTSTDHIASFCETQNPDHQYVSEILLASGLLLKDLSSRPRNLMPIQLHPLGYAINPDLFLVLEQTKSGWLPQPESVYEDNLHSRPDPEKLHRKLVFDVANEILVQKLELSSLGLCSGLLLRAIKFTNRFLSGQCLLKELCSEIEQLQADSSRVGTFEDDNLISGEDLLHRSDGDFGRELQRLVLEIERSIFKDLVDEVVCGEAASGLQARPSRRRRQLFAM